MATDEATDQAVRAEARSWFEDNWDPDLTLEDWWDRFGRSGWAFPTWPSHAFGRGLNRDDAYRPASAMSAVFETFSGTFTFTVARTAWCPGWLAQRPA